MVSACGHTGGCGVSGAGSAAVRRPAHPARHAGAGELLGQAADIAGQIGAGQDYRTASFGPAAVELAHVVAAVELGDARQAVRRHEAVARRHPWQGLPAEYRAAYLVDAARAHLEIGDFAAAGRWLVEADRVAPAEIRCRPSARTVVAEVARCGPGVAGVARLATALGLTRSQPRVTAN
ncbi:hypothetical protein [Micromonospora sp. NBC_01813]|uniref:hypothetical protein n=1 Tax=Micromonospora sp. NBC_01813 TaxID=2975988 RepID=UPI002DDB5905|nr:hypothetical protein [Micromonospora sp. NBC_01813]WSA08101.1 hypothetical protein OG958_28470 [Micromonospora sp. NBC_01813]